MSGGLDSEPTADSGIPSLPPRASEPREKDSRDTALGCRDRAAADRLEAGSMDTVNGRQRLEQSAASWASRAALLQRLEDKAEARAALGAAKSPTEDEDSDF